MIYLFGLTHTIQTELDSPGPRLSEKYGRLKAFLSDAIHSNTVVAIAEETNLEIEDHKKKKSIARIIAEGMHRPLPYMPCEPNSDERKALGIPTGEEIIDRCLREYNGDALGQCRDSELLKYFPLREKFWIERLRQVAVSPILFVCGPDHIRTFSCHLTENGIPCKIISFDWCASDETEYGVLPLDEMPI